jgi:predicted nucleic acid-binding Zn ribbon protein
MNPHLLGDVLRKYIQSKPLGENLERIEILTRWEELCPPIIAKYARPTGLKGKKLSLVVNSSAWLNELSFFKKELINTLNQKAGKELIKEIRFHLEEE